MSELNSTQLWRILVHRKDGSVYWETSRYTNEEHAHQLLKSVARLHGGGAKVSHVTLYSEEEYKKYLETKK